MEQFNYYNLCVIEAQQKLTKRGDRRKYIFEEIQLAIQCF